MIKHLLIPLCLLSTSALAGDYIITLSGDSTAACTISFSTEAESVDGTYPLEAGDITAFSCTIAEASLTLDENDLNYGAGLDFTVSGGEVTALDLQTKTANAFQLGNASPTTISNSWQTYGSGTLLNSANNYAVIAVSVVVNSAPVAVNDTASVSQGTPTIIPVLANDSDADPGDTLTVTNVTDPPDGTAVIGGGGAFVAYTSDDPFTSNPDTFDYTVSDGDLTDTATVTVTRLIAPLTLAQQASAMGAGDWEQLDTVNAFDDEALTTTEADDVCTAAPGGCTIPIYTSTHPGWTTLSKWGTAAWDEANKIGYFWGSGHADGGNNEVYQLDLGTLTWTRLTDPAPLNLTSGSYVLPTDGNSDGKPDTPPTPHGYDGLVWDPVAGGVFTVSANTIYTYGSPQSGIPLLSWWFDPGTLTWTSHDTSAFLYYPQCVYEVGQSRVFCITWITATQKRIFMYDSATGAETDCGSNWTTNTIIGGVGTAFYDATDQEYYVLNANGLWKLNMAGCSTTATHMAEPSDRVIAAMGFAGDPLLKQACPFRAGSYIYFWNTQPVVARYDPSGDSWDMVWNEGFQSGNGPAVLGGDSSGQDREFSKCSYFSDVGVMVGISTPQNDAQGGVWIWKPGANPSDINKLKVGALTLDGSTQTTISVFLAATKDRNYDADAYIEYREVGAGSWTRGMDLFRQFTEGFRNSRGLPPNPQGFAGMIWGLTPDTDYEVRVVFSDSDGLATGSATSPRTLSSVSTKALPTTDYTGFSTATITDPSASALNAAIKTACDDPNTGHVFTIGAGVTIDGPVVIRPTTNTSTNKCGTATTPFVLRGANRTTSVVNGGGGTAIWAAADNIIVENLSFTNADTGVDASGLSNKRELENITVREVTGTSTLHGIVTRGYFITDFYVADNDLTGPKNPLETTHGGAAYGVEVSGKDIEVEHNTLRGFIDAIAMSDPNVIDPSYLNHSAAYHHNWIVYNADDGMEFDFTHRNVIGHDNLVTNSADCLSFQPVWGGPAIAVFNVCYNFERGPIKIKAENENPNGIIIWNNTFLGNGSNFVNAGVPTVGLDMRNNIFFAEGTLTNTAATKASGEWPLTLNVVDYNAWGQEGPFDFDNQYGSTWTAWKAAGPFGANSILISGEESTTFTFVPDFDDTGSGSVFDGALRDASGKNFDLHASSSARDAGVEIPGVTPVGDNSPDMGACEASGCDATATFYGVR